VVTGAVAVGAVQGRGTRVAIWLATRPVCRPTRARRRGLPGARDWTPCPDRLDSPARALARFAGRARALARFAGRARALRLDAAAGLPRRRCVARDSGGSGGRRSV
jgi:hypothetical protein